MKCDSVVDALPLYLYGELNAHQEEEVEAHLHGCPSCQRELTFQKQIHATLNQRRMTATALLAAECRRDLMQSVQRQPRQSRSGWFGAFLESLAGVRLSARPIGALALVALGFFSARLTLRDANPGAFSPLAIEPMVSTIRSVQPQPSGGVRISFDETRRRSVTGKVEDDNIERMLIAAARDEGNAGLRVESMEILKNLSGSVEVREALIYALTHDPNPGVRLTALEGLKGMASHPEVRKSLAQVLQKDNNAGVRIMAIDLLVQTRDVALVGILQGLVSRENNNYVRLRCKSALEEMNASVGTF